MGTLRAGIIEADVLNDDLTLQGNGTGSVKLGTAMDGDDQEVSKITLKDYSEVTNAVGSIGGGAQSLDLTLGNVISATVDTATTTFSFDNPIATDDCSGFTLVLINGGAFTVNWPSSVDWAGATAPTLTAAGTDILCFFTIDGGTIWHGAVASLESS